MKELFTEDEYKKSKSTDQLPCECTWCKSTFYIEKKEVTRERKHRNGRSVFCSKLCYGKSMVLATDEKCAFCEKKITVMHKEKRKSKSGNHFCSMNCSAKYNNRSPFRKKRRSKIEVVLGIAITQAFPDTRFVFNSSLEIGRELDIYIPEKKIAIEINGPHHYRPIYGNEKFKKTVENDLEKKVLCDRYGISLFVLDVSMQRDITFVTTSLYIKELLLYLKKELEAPGVEPGSESLP